MFLLRRMKIIKVFKDGNKLFVKLMILKSFLLEVIWIVIFFFVNNIFFKGFCECLVGKCGFCCYVIVIFF